MAKRMALIPEEIISHYQLPKKELSLENEIENLLKTSELPDDMKVKLLSQLIKKYHHIVHAPTKPIPVSLIQENTQQETLPQIDDEFHEYKIKED